MIQKVSILEIVRILMQNRTTESLFEAFSSGVKLLNKTSMKEIQTVVTTKQQVDNRDESFLLTTLWKN